jgi:hypothetical protein
MTKRCRQIDLNVVFMKDIECSWHQAENHEKTEKTLRKILGRFRDF